MNSTASDNPFWVVLGVKIAESTIVVMGFAKTELEARIAGEERRESVGLSPSAPVNVFQISSAKVAAQQMRQWFVSLGLGASASLLVRLAANGILECLEKKISISIQ